MMKKTKRIAMVTVLCLLLTSVTPVQAATASGADFETCLYTALGVSLSNCQDTDAVTFSCSDNCGMTSAYTGKSGISIGGWSNYSYNYDLTFSESGWHSVNAYKNGTLAATTSVYVYAEHQYGAETITRTASCTQTGLKKKTCSICGHEQTETIPMTDHAYVEETVEATCTTDGETHKKCTVCGDTVVLATIPALGHDYETKVTPATIFKDGKETATCSRCGDTKTKVLEKLPSSVTLSKKKVTVKVGKTYTLKVKKKTAGDKVKSWKSSKKKVATVDKNGKVKAIKAGTATITVQMKSGCSAKCKVTVKK